MVDVELRPMAEVEICPWGKYNAAKFHKFEFELRNVRFGAHEAGYSPDVQIIQNVINNLANRNGLTGYDTGKYLRLNSKPNFPDYHIFEYELDGHKTFIHVLK